MTSPFKVFQYIFTISSYLVVEVKSPKSADDETSSKLTVDTESSVVYKSEIVEGGNDDASTAGVKEDIGAVEDVPEKYILISHWRKKIAIHSLLIC